MVLIPRAPPPLPCSSVSRLYVFLIAPAFNRERLPLLIPGAPSISHSGLQKQPVETVRRFLLKANPELSTELAAPLLCIQPRALNIPLHTRSSTRVFAAALLTVGRRQKRPEPPQ